MCGAAHCSLPQRVAAVSYGAHTARAGAGRSRTCAVQWWVFTFQIPWPLGETVSFVGFCVQFACVCACVLIFGSTDDSLTLLQRCALPSTPFNLSESIPPAECSYLSPQYSASFKLRHNSDSVADPLKAFDLENSKRDSAAVSLSLSMSIKPSPSHVYPSPPRFGAAASVIASGCPYFVRVCVCVLRNPQRYEDNYSLPVIMRDLVYTALHGQWTHVDAFLRRCESISRFPLPC